MLLTKPNNSRQRSDRSFVLFVVAHRKKVRPAAALTLPLPHAMDGTVGPVSVKHAYLLLLAERATWTEYFFTQLVKVSFLFFAWQPDRTMR